MVVVVVVADRGDLGNVVMSSSYERKRGKNEKNNRDEIGTFSCSGLSIISAIPEPGESERLGFGWLLSIKNSTRLPGEGVRGIAV